MSDDSAAGPDGESSERPGSADGASFDALVRQAARISLPSELSARFVLPSGSALAGGRLSIVRPIGEGGMGIVYEAFDAERKTLVALKTLSRMDAHGVYRLKNEFRSLDELRHPNVVNLYDLFADGPHWFFTMELIRGERFDRWVRPPRADEESEASAHPLDDSRLRALLPQLVAGITAIHAAGKLHRDLKPGNVLVTPGGRAVLLDFSLAVDPEPGGVGQTIHDGAVSGTPAYMAPEQAAGELACRASDFYALGVMLFEALTGRLPFEGRAHDMLAEKQRRAAPGVLTLSPHAPTDLAAWCDALLQRDPSARPIATVHEARLGPVRAPEVSSVGAKREPLLGRDHELATLRAAYEATCSGRPVVTFVSGESGLGKSTLVAHFLDDLRVAAHAVVLTGRCYERESVPFKGLDSLVDDLSRLLRRLPREEVAALLPREVHALARVFPVLARIDAIAHAPAKAIADPQELRQRAFSAFSELLNRIRDRRPLVLHVDDAQWLDRDALTFLDFMLGQHDPTPLLFVLSHRSAGVATESPLARLGCRVRENPSWQCRELVLEPLSSAAARELAARLLGADDDGRDDGRVEQLAVQSTGNPFLLGELARLSRTSGGIGLTLHEMLLAQARALSASAQRVIEVLAIAARPLPVKLALDAADAGYEQLDDLHAVRLLAARGSDDERRLECYHDKIRESVTRALPLERVREVHARLLAAMIERGADADAEHVALHAEGAGEPAVAARFAALAGDAAALAMAFERAAASYERALRLGEHDDTARRELLCKLGDALASAGRGAAAARAFLEAVQGLPAPDAFDLERRAAQQLLISGQIDDGKALLDQVLRAVGHRLPASPKRALLALVWERLRLTLRGLSFHERAGALPPALEREFAALQTASHLAAVDPFTGAALNCRYARLALDSGSHRHAAVGLGLVAFSFAVEEGEPATDKVAALFARSEALANACGDRDVLAILRFEQASVGPFLGAHPAHIKPQCEQAAELLHEVPHAWLERCLARSLAHAAGEWSGSFAPVAELAGLVDEAWRRGDVYSAVTFTHAGAVARLCRGDADGLARHLAQARRAWRRARDYGYADFLLLNVEVLLALHADEPERALERMRADWPAIEAAQLLRAPLLRYMLLGRRTRAAFLASARDAADAPALRAKMRSDVRELERARLSIRIGTFHLLSAMLALREQRFEAAAALLRAAASECERTGWHPQAAVARRRLGTLVGGEEGAALRAQADAALQAMGVVELDAALRVL